jgi:hypothetical protein
MPRLNGSLPGSCDSLFRRQYKIANACCLPANGRMGGDGRLEYAYDGAVMVALNRI